MAKDTKVKQCKKCGQWLNSVENSSADTDDGTVAWKCPGCMNKMTVYPPYKKGEMRKDRRAA